MKKFLAVFALVGAFLISMINQAGATLTGAINTVAGGGIDTATSILSGDLGVIIYTLLGLTILGIVITVVRSFLRK